LIEAYYAPVVLHCYKEKIPVKPAKKIVLVTLTFFSLYCCKSVGMNVNLSEITDFQLVKGEPVVTVKINNKKLKLYIDTGANLVQIALKPNVIKDLGLTESIEESKSMDIEGHVYNEKKYIVSEMNFHIHKFTNIIVKEEKRDFFAYDGIIGNELLSKYVLFLDYKEKKIGLLNQDEKQKIIGMNEWMVIKYTNSKAGLLLPIKINGKLLNFIFDTGAAVIDNENSYGLMRKSSVVKQSLFEITKENMNVVSLKNIEIAGNKFEEMGFLQVDLPEQFPADGLIGYNLVKERKVVIDYKNNVMYLN
jgi:hypothetical protein